MSWLKEVKARVANLSLCQALQERVAVLCHELRCQLNGFHLLVGKGLVGDLELLGAGCLYFLKLYLFCSNLQSIDLLPQLVLKISLAVNGLFCWLLLSPV